MAKPPETKVKDAIKALCKKHGAYYRLDVKMGMATNGDPDFDVCHAGRFAGVEAKAGKGQPTALQWIKLKEIEAAGGAAFLINETNLDELELWLTDKVPPKGNLHLWSPPSVLEKLDK